MELTKNVKTVLVCYATLIAIVIYDVVAMLTHPDWGKQMPMFVMQAMPFQVAVLFPLLVLLSGVFIALVLNGMRSGMIGIIAVGGVVNVLWNLAAGYWRIAAGHLDGATICFVGVVLGAGILYYSFRAMGETVPETISRQRSSVEV